MILTPDQMTAAEEAAFARGVSQEAAMNKAALGVAEAIRRFFPEPGTIVLYLGRGHNAGDALEAARHLFAWGWQIGLRYADDPAKFRPLTAKKHSQFLATTVPRGDSSRQPLLLIDALLGIGAKGPPQGAFAVLVREINRLRRERHATTIALDLPTGLDGTSGQPSEDTVQADFTLTIACAKTGLLADEAERCVGRLEIIPLPEILPKDAPEDAAHVLQASSLRQLLPPRSATWHKGRAGRVAVLAGSPGFSGAACLCSEAAVSAGAGLVTLLADERIYPIVATRSIPEVMVHSAPPLTTSNLSSVAATCFAVGPGLGAGTPESLLDWLSTETRPVVVDADALNLLARYPAVLKEVAAAGPRLLTPHPGEFERLFPAAAKLPSRRTQAESVTSDSSFVLLYKGSRTIISQAGQPCAFNCTGNPGMATGGMGDVLTGVCAGLIGQGLLPFEAACLGAWLCGRSAELAVSLGRQTQQTLRPSHVIQYLAEAFRDLR